MSVRGLASAAMVALTVAGSGCVTCPPTACHRVTREAGPSCSLPRSDRDRVYVFLIDGFNPIPTLGLDDLRRELQRNGFAKIGVASLFHSGWVVGEMERIHRADTSARFVLVGCDIGANGATWATAAAAKRGLHIEALVLLDPIGNLDAMRNPDVRTVVIRSGGAAKPIAQGEAVQVPEATPFSLAGHPTTANTIVAILEGVGAAVSAESPPPPVAFGLEGRESPTVPLPKLSDADREVGWDFLDERPSGTSMPLGADGETQLPAGAPSRP